MQDVARQGLGAEAREAAELLGQHRDRHLRAFSLLSPAADHKLIAPKIRQRRFAGLRGSSQKKNETRRLCDGSHVTLLVPWLHRSWSAEAGEGHLEP